MSRRAWIILAVLVCLLFSGVMRGYFFSKPGFLTDMNWQCHWAQTVQREGFWKLYHGDYSSRENRKNLHEIVDYPPGVPLADGAVLGLFHVEKHRERALRVIKGFYSALDLLLLVLLVWLLWRGKGKWWVPAACLLAVNPAVAFPSEAWGQCDPMLAIEFVLALYLGVTERYWAGGACVCAAVLTKPQGGLCVVVYAAVLLARGKWRPLAAHALAGAIVLGGLIWAFRRYGESDFLAPYLNAKGAYPVLSWSAFNFWWAFYGVASSAMQDSLRWGPLPCGVIGTLLFALSFLFGCFYLLRAPRTVENVFIFAAWVGLTFFLFLTEMHERYAYYPLVLLALPAARHLFLLCLSVPLSALVYFNSTWVFRNRYPDQFPDWIVPYIPEATQKGLSCLALACGAGLAGFMIWQMRGTGLTVIGDAVVASDGPFRSLAGQPEGTPSARLPDESVK